MSETGDKNVVPETGNGHVCSSVYWGDGGVVCLVD